MVEPVAELVGQLAACLVLTSVIFNVVYWMKKTCDNLRRPPVTPKPPKILTDQYWPIKNSILKHLSLEDILNLKNAYPSIQLQMWEEKERARVKFVQEVIEFDPWGCSSIQPPYIPHSHSAHPIFKAIEEKSRLSGLEREMKMEEIKQMIWKFGPDINKIPRVQPKFENSVQTQNAFVKFCDWEGLTPLLFCTFKDDLETVRLLVENGSDIYETGDSMHQNCLHATVPRPSLKVARYLIEEVKMDRERLDGEQQTALDVASKMVEWFGGADSIELVQLLTE